MIPKGLFTQIGMVIISVAIVITYIKPEFAKISAIQDDISLYQQKSDEVVSVNSKLSALQAQKDSLSDVDKERLYTYLPESVDSLKVSRDLLLITLQSGAVYKDVTSEDVSDSKNTSKNNRSRKTQSNVNADAPKPHTFNLSVEGTYEQLKSLFSLLEKNNYPLEIQTVDINKTDGGFLTAEISMITYSYNSAEDNN